MANFKARTLDVLELLLASQAFATTCFPHPVKQTHCATIVISGVPHRIRGSFWSTMRRLSAASRDRTNSPASLRGKRIGAPAARIGAPWQPSPAPEMEAASGLVWRL